MQHYCPAKHSGVCWGLSRLLMLDQVFTKRPRSSLKVVLMRKISAVALIAIIGSAAQAQDAPEFSGALSFGWQSLSGFDGLDADGPTAGLSGEFDVGAFRLRGVYREEFLEANGDEVSFSHAAVRAGYSLSSGEFGGYFDRYGFEGEGFYSLGGYYHQDFRNFELTGIVGRLVTDNSDGTELGLQTDFRANDQFTIRAALSGAFSDASGDNDIYSSGLGAHYEWNNGFGLQAAVSRMESGDSDFYLNNFSIGASYSAEFSDRDVVLGLEFERESGPSGEYVDVVSLGVTIPLGSQQQRTVLTSNFNRLGELPTSANALAILPVGEGR